MRLQNLVWIAVLSTLAASWVSADNSGTILLTVTGPGGAAMAGAAVVVSSRSLIAPRTAAADARGKVLLAPTSAAFRALDADHNGVLTSAEFAAAPFGSTAGNVAGVNFLRQQLEYAGVNNVGQTDWAFFL